ncbi:MAG: methyl-accepting chemotaxis protein, partial [Clostridiales bacterium]|nr:methyl-accepting chemotaxis protein [Clostridiales bacterium]
MSADEGVKIFEAVISKELAILEELARHENVISMDWEMQQEYIKPNVQRLGYLEIGVVTPDGIAHYISDNSTADLGDRDYIKKAFQGQTNVSNVLISRATNKPVVMIAAPIKSGNDIVGVLVARKDGVAFSDITDELGYGANGYAYLLGLDGTFYAHNNSEYVLEQRNIFDDIETEGIFKDVVLAFQKLGMGNKGVIRYDFLGSKRYMGVQPIPDTDWVLCVGTFESDALAGVRKLQNAILYSAIGFLILGITIALFLGKTISKPIIEYSKILDRMSTYDFSYDEKSKALKYLKRKDEIGKIGNSIATMQKNVITLVKQISNISQQVASSSEELTATSQQSSMASEEIAKAIADISQGASDQASDTEKGAVSAEELGGLIERNKQAVEKLIMTIEAINKLKEEGLLVVEDLVEKTKSSGEAAEGIRDVIINTNESAERIQAASQMIKSIAEQTNLLALNAAIEAARAGEAGRGFTVVAQEIRKLAEESNKFTEEIEVIIQELAEKTGMAVDTMEETRDIIRSQAESVEDTHNKYVGIADSIEDMKKHIEAINESEKLMEQKKNDVINIMQNLSAISEENAAGTEEASASVEEQTAAMAEIASASESLARLADEMQQSVIKFKF